MRHKHIDQMNIGESEKRKRLILGYVMLIITTICYVVLLLFAFPWRYSLSLILPVALMFFGFLQAKEST